MFKKLFGMMVFLIVLFVGVGCFAMQLTNNKDVYTGMSYEKVAEELNLEHFKTDRNLAMYHRVDSAAYYVFNAGTDQLMYKLVIYKAEKFNEMLNRLTDAFGEPVKLKNENNSYTYFFKKSHEKGYKLSYVSDKHLQLWYGSIPLWNDFCDQNPGMRPFPF